MQVIFFYELISNRDWSNELMNVDSQNGRPTTRFFVPSNYWLTCLLFDSALGNDPEVDLEKTPNLPLDLAFFAGTIITASCKLGGGHSARGKLGLWQKKVNPGSPRTIQKIGFHQNSTIFLKGISKSSQIGAILFLIIVFGLLSVWVFWCQHVHEIFPLDGGLPMYPIS